MSIGEIKNMFKSFLKFWWMSPEAIYEVCREKKESGGNATATTKLTAYKRFYK